MEMRPGCWPDTSAAAAVHRHAVVAAADAVALAASTAAADLASSVAVPPSCNVQSRVLAQLSVKIPTLPTNAACEF